MAGRLLGLGCGELNGSAELLLKAALMAAEERGAEVELVRLNELRIPSGPTRPSPMTPGGTGRSSSRPTR